MLTVVRFKQKQTHITQLAKSITYHVLDISWQNVYGVEPTATASPRLLALLVGLHWYLSSLFSVGTLVFVPVYYMAFCRVLIHAFRVHNQRLQALHKERVNALIAIDLATIRAFYERICALALEVNSAFGKVVFAWYIKIVLSICVDATQLFSDHELLGSANQEETFLFSLRILYSFLTFLGTCIAAAQVSESAQRPLPILHTLTLRSSRLDMNTKMEAHFFPSRLTASPVVLTGWDFFVISRSFILRVAAAIATYIVIMIQMNPKAMRTVNRLVSTALNSTTNSTNTAPMASRVT
ncbi:hypothetical protein BIW11_09829 [Tropilaelaps mercedesae]|uniref:Uncharacterized protein n=1 Tax=Tropilaelaps mercedesae TaxID=418985 RepID=A0A1V9XIA5_9ACAR|nr:hypothetical protein BIW11_09829 [Tropilaelaps mercedesae]